MPDSEKRLQLQGSEASLQGGTFNSVVITERQGLSLCPSNLKQGKKAFSSDSPQNTVICSICAPCLEYISLLCLLGKHSSSRPVSFPLRVSISDPSCLALS